MSPRRCPIRRARRHRARRTALGVRHRRHGRRDAGADRRSSQGEGNSRVAGARAAPAHAARPEQAPGLRRLSAPPPTDAIVPRGSRAHTRDGVRQSLSLREGGRGGVHRYRPDSRLGARGRRRGRGGKRAALRTSSSTRAVARRHRGNQSKSPRGRRRRARVGRHRSARRADRRSRRGTRHAARRPRPGAAAASSPRTENMPAQ